jgi:N6-L-threonylcarbamoyladenine synthase
VHHLEAHLLSPLLADPAPDFPFVALLVSGGHTQLLVAESVGRYRLLGDTLDDAAGEAFDKSAKMLGLPYPGGPALSALARQGRPGRFRLPRPMLRSGDLDFSFSGLKTAVLTQIRREPDDEQTRADLAAEIECAITDVLAAKSLAALRETGLGRLVVAGGVSANSRLRERLAEGCSAAGHELYLPPPALCTDNGVMIALAASLRLQAGLEAPKSYRFDVRPRWPLSELAAESERVG